MGTRIHCGPPPSMYPKTHFFFCVSQAKFKSFQKLVDYCTADMPQCRQVVLASAFGDTVAATFQCGHCDVCADKGKVVRMIRKYKHASGMKGRVSTTVRDVMPSNRYDTTLVDDQEDDEDSEGECIDHVSMESR